MTSLVAGCMACELVSGRSVQPGGTIFEDAHWHVDTAKSANVWPGFLMIKLKRHCVHLAELTAPEAASLGSVIRVTNRALMEVLQPAKIYVCSFGDGNAHIHLWILPRPAGMKAGMHPVIFNLDMRIFLTRVLHLKKWLVPEARLAQIAEAVRAGIGKMDRP
jgi:diadenosine tetraphosphate (Ap4A) HIT family hydrolase